MNRSHVVLSILLLMLVLLNADQMVMSPNLEAIQREFHVQERDIGLIQGSFTLIGAVVSLFFGYWSDRSNRRRLIAISALIATLPCFLSAFVRSWNELFMARALTGLGVGALFPVIFSYTGDIFPSEKRAGVNAFLSTAMSLGAIVGMLVAGFMGSSFGWRAPFLVISSPTFILVPLFLLLSKEPERGAAEVAVGDLVKQGLRYETVIKASDYLNLFRVKTNLLLFLQGIAGTIPWGAIPYYLVYFLEGTVGFSKEQATTIFMAFGAGNVLGVVGGGLAGGILYRKRASALPLLSSVSTFLGLLAVLAALNLSIQPDTKGFIVISAFGFLASALASITGPNMKTMLMELNAPAQRGRIFSVFNVTDSLGAGAGQFLGGTLATLLGSMAASLNIAAFFWAPCALLLLFAVKTFPSDLEAYRAALRRQAAEMQSATEAAPQ